MISECVNGSELGYNIKQRRELEGWSQEELGQKLNNIGNIANGNYGQANISQWENGKRGVPDDILVQLALLFDCEVSELLVNNIDEYKWLVCEDTQPTILGCTDIVNGRQVGHINKIKKRVTKWEYICNNAEIDYKKADKLLKKRLLKKRLAKSSKI